MITDLTPYRHLVDKFDISEKQKLELVNALWVMAECIIDEQFGLKQIEPKSMSKKYEETFGALNQKHPRGARTKKILEKRYHQHIVPKEESLKTTANQHLEKMVPLVGLEPTTYGLQNRCSTS